MKKELWLLICCLLMLSMVYGQNSNDDCENATDITYAIYNDSIWSGDVFVGDLIQNPSVDGAVYGSSGCWGYTEVTSDLFPDIWYKCTLQANHSYVQSIYISSEDTVQIASYFGTCGNLFQSECYTIPPVDTFFDHFISLDYIPHNINHDMYIQVKMPTSANGTHFGMLIYYPFYLFVTLYFQYSEPATTGNTGLKNPKEEINPIKVFPNPASNAITIKSKDVIQNIEWLNLNGTTLLKSTAYSNTATQDISFLSSGLYWVKICTSKGMAISKVLIIER